MAKQAYHVCFNCKNREIGCHAKCKMYIKEQEEARKQKEERQKNSFYSGIHKEARAKYTPKHKNSHMK